MFNIKCTKCGFTYTGKLDPSYTCPKCQNTQCFVTLANLLKEGYETLKNVSKFLARASKSLQKKVIPEK